MKIFAVLGLLISVAVVSCKKDKLKDEKAFLIGTWNWTQTTHDCGWCEGESFEETLTPESEESDF
jgi:hypothetical protein